MTEERKKEDALLDGSHDGIQEYDNDLPKWWLGLFYITLVFGGIYAIYVHMSGANTDLQILKSEMASIAQLKHVETAAISSEDRAALLTDAKEIEKGKAIFAARCVACHGAQGEGVVGPNLTDAYWIHGGTPDAIRSVIEKGVLEKGMLAWKGVIPDADITSVLSFIWSIRNTNHPGKAPQGDLVSE